MRLIKFTIMLVVVMGVGYGFSVLMRLLLPVEVLSWSLTVVGAVTALVNAVAFQVLRRLDDPPVKQLTPDRASRILRKFERRRSSFRFKWGGAIAASVLSSLAGTLARLATLTDYSDVLISIGFITFFTALTLGILITVEYSVLSKVARDLPGEIENLRKKNDLLVRLQGRPSSSPTSSVSGS